MLTKNLILLRFAVNWILLTGIFTLLFWVRDSFIYTNRIGKNWQFNRPVLEETLLAIGIMFFFICAIFYLLEYFMVFKNKRRWLKTLTLILIFYIVTLILASVTIGFSFSSILKFQPLFFILLFAVAILLLDKAIVTIMRVKH